MQTEQLLCWTGMVDTEHSTTSGSNKEEQQKMRRGIINSIVCAYTIVRILAKFL